MEWNGCYSTSIRSGAILFLGSSRFCLLTILCRPSACTSFVVDFHAFYVRLAKVEHFIYSQRYILRGCTLYGYARIHLHTVAWHAQIDGRYHLCTHAWIYTKRPMTPKAFGGTSMDTYKFVNRQKSVHGFVCMGW